MLMSGGFVVGMDCASAKLLPVGLKGKSLDWCYVPAIYWDLP